MIANAFLSTIRFGHSQWIKHITITMPFWSEDWQTRSYQQRHWDHPPTRAAYGGIIWHWRRHELSYQQAFGRLMYILGTM